MTPDQTPPPGHPESVKLGCKCPVLDNAHGKGYMGMPGLYVYTAGCPLHQIELVTEQDSSSS